MKNIYILKGWFNMEEIKNGVISEEALEEVAGGLNIPKITLKKAIIAAGVAVAALSTIGGTTAAGYEIYKYTKNKKGKDSDKTKVGTGSPSVPTVGTGSSPVSSSAPENGSGAANK